MRTSSRLSSGGGSGGSGGGAAGGAAGNAADGVAAVAGGSYVDAEGAVPPPPLGAKRGPAGSDVRVSDAQIAEYYDVVTAGGGETARRRVLAQTQST